VPGADDLSRALRGQWRLAVAAAVAVAVVALLVGGPEAAGLAVLGGLLGVANLLLAAGALRRAPAAFIGSSLPRLLVVTVAVVVLVELLGPVGMWALAGLLVAHVVQVAALVRFGTKALHR